MERKQVGDFTLLKQLGQGTLGTVYLAEHRGLKKEFILKIFPEELAIESNFVKNFEKEIPQICALDHPNIEKIHYASFADGIYFLAMDFQNKESKNLFQYLKDRKEISEEEIYKIVVQVGSALDYAHDSLPNKIAHLSLKPQNILIDADAEDIKVKVTDFGISQLVGPGVILNRMYKSLGDSLMNTSDHGSFLEKRISEMQKTLHQGYAFLAPEQKTSEDVIKVGASADVYSFGVLIYHLFMRRYPEGIFELPSLPFPYLERNWDELLHHLLQYSPFKRPQGLLKAMDTYLPCKVEVGAGNISSSEKTREMRGGTSYDLKPVLLPGEIQRPEFVLDPSIAFQKDSTIGRYQIKVNEPKKIEPILTNMVIIKGGSFFRGSNQGARDEMPRHSIMISDFALDIHPVTNEQFVLFLETMGGEKDYNNLDMIRLRDSRIKRIGGKLTIESGYSKHPVVGVAWYGAVAYAKWIGKRLPTEAEWEIAAAGGLVDSIYPSGMNMERSQANFFSSDTTSVMSYPPNAYGLYDMAGNVYEWCHDWYEFHYYDTSVQEPSDPRGPQQGIYRVLRGGCWKSLKEDLRIAHRHRNNPGTMNGTYGFRCAADVETAS